MVDRLALHAITRKMKKSAVLFRKGDIGTSLYAVCAGAIRISAALALVVQIITFAVARRVTRTNMMVGWGLGTLLRVLTLALYAFLVVPAIALPASAALISLVIFLFLSMLVEPLLLAYDR
jgi:CRP-like cAMP-binding protein